MKNIKYYILATDWTMPEMKGKELVERLKSQEGLICLPVLMLTAEASGIDQLPLIKTRVEESIRRSFDESSLKNHIPQLLDFADGEFRVDSSKEPGTNEIKDIHLFDEVSLSKTDQIFLDHIEEIILKNISNFLFTTETISSELEMSSRNLRRKVKKLAGLTTSQYIQEIRYREAKRMLIEKEYSTVKAVIYSVGIKSTKYFSREFKKRFGKYPKEFLK